MINMNIQACTNGADVMVSLASKGHSCDLAYIFKTEYLENQNCYRNITKHLKFIFLGKNISSLKFSPKVIF